MPAAGMAMGTIATMSTGMSTGIAMSMAMNTRTAPNRHRRTAIPMHTIMDTDMGLGMNTGTTISMPRIPKRPGRTGTIPIMLTDAALQPLLAWTSPAYPIGAFTYSHGLETAVDDGRVKRAEDIVAYVEAVMTRGGGWVDAVLFGHGWRAAAGEPDASAPDTMDPDTLAPDGPAPERTVPDRTIPASAALGVPAADAAIPDIAAPDMDALEALADLAAAFRGSAETRLESLQQGSSFLQVTRRAWPHPALDAFAARRGEAPVAHCLVMALACAAHGLPLAASLHAYLHGLAANLVSAGVRLIPLGQTDGQIATAALSRRIPAIAARALATPLDDLGTAAPLLELASFHHETLYTRLFRS